MKKIYSTYRTYFILLLFFLSGHIALAQTTLKGKITDEATGEPLIGAIITQKSTSNATVTDIDGAFSILIKDSLPVTLVLSYISYLEKEIEVFDPEIPIAVTLKPKLSSDEIVVVGYGEVQRKNLIGSVSSVDPGLTKDIPAGGVDAQLQGKIAGVQISSSTGVPGEAANVRVRGATSINGSNNPLYIVDGVFINGNSLQTIGTGGKATSPIADINPSDIERIEVLKDAEATALYGVRGANGVIIVTTKRGNFEQKPTTSFNTTQGWAKAVKLWDLATGPEHAQLVNENFLNTGGIYQDRPFRSKDEPNSKGVKDGRGTPEEQQTYDRLSEAFRTARLQSYDLSIAGGTKSTRYYIGGGYNSQESILKPITFERASFKVNLDQKLNDKVQVGVSNMFSRTFRNQARAGDGPQGGLLQSALHTPTYLSPTNDQGEPVGRAGFDNLTLLLENYDVKSVSLRYIGNLYLEAKLHKNLKFRSSFGTDYNNYNETENWNNKLLLGSPAGYSTRSISQYTSLLNEQTLNYTTKLASKHSVGVLLGNTLQSDVSTRLYAEARGFPNNSFSELSGASTTTGYSAGQDVNNPNPTWTKNTLSSFFSKFDYNFSEKYYINFSVRADGSSRFGTNNKWGYFPTVGGAWRVKQEGFLKDNKLISDLKLRASYGITGNQNGLGNFASQALWNAGTNYQGGPGISPLQLSNPDLRWEKTSQFNIGLDLAVFNDRLAFDFNYYKKYTKDGLLKVALPASTGYTSQWQNALEVSNKGFELGINSVNVKGKNFTWTINFNVARNINKIEKLENPLKYGSRDLILQKEGSPMYSFWVYKENGVDPNTGNVIYEDANGDGKITADDRQLLGSIWPKFFGGLTNSLSYKGFDLNIFFAYSYGNKVYNHNRFFGEGGGSRDAARVILASNVDRWQKPGDETDTPRPDGVNNNNYKDGGGRWLEDGSYLRLRSLALGYTVPKRLSQKIKVESFRVFVQGTNLYTYTKYTGLDPEASANSDQNQQGIDLGTPPQPRGFQIGLNIVL